MKSYCRYCSAEINQNTRTKPKLYCSDSCRFKYWNRNRNETTKRNQHELVCGHCGESFRSYDNNRKYCDHECYIAARFGRDIQLERKKHATRTIVFEAYEGEPPEPTFDERSSLEANESFEPLPMLPVRITYGNEKLNPRRVYMLAGTYKFYGKFDYFVGLIPHWAKEQLMDGDVFVYCNQQRTQISVLQWQGDGFALFFKRAEYDRYYWPYSSEIKLIEVTPSDLRMLLEIPHFKQRINEISAV